jgi:hypothetical protein
VKKLWLLAMMLPDSHWFPVLDTQQNTGPRRPKSAANMMT